MNEALMSAVKKSEELAMEFDKFCSSMAESGYKNGPLNFVANRYFNGDKDECKRVLEWAQRNHLCIVHPRKPIWIAWKNNIPAFSNHTYKSLRQCLIILQNGKNKEKSENQQSRGI